MKKIIPCNNCICVAICRHRHFIDMRVACQILTNYLLKDGKKVKGYREKIVALFHYLEPTKWGYLPKHRKETILDMEEESCGNYLLLPIDREVW